MTLPVKNLKDKDGNGFQPNVPDKVGYFSTSGTAKSWNEPWTAPSDGWVEIYGRFTANNSIFITINGLNVLECGSDTDNIGIILQRYPVKKGDTVRGHGGVNPTSEHPNITNFYQNRTALDGGGV